MRERQRKAARKQFLSSNHRGGVANSSCQMTLAEMRLATPLVKSMDQRPAQDKICSPKFEICNGCTFDTKRWLSKECPREANQSVSIFIAFSTLERTTPSNCFCQNVESVECDLSRHFAISILMLLRSFTLFLVKELVNNSETHVSQ